jgi:hydroxymethylglutaryl-CoA lyase
MSLPSTVKIVEVGPRDGLQNEKAFVPTDVKIDLVNRLSAASFRNVEALHVRREHGVDGACAALDAGHHLCAVCHLRHPLRRDERCGFDGALAAHAASEAFSQKNINCGIAESIARFEPVARAAKESGLRVRGSISCALGCPYQGDVPVPAVVDVVQRMAALGCDEIDIADTIGVGTPGRTREIFAAVTKVFPREQLSGHFHDTYGQALANIYAALLEGIEIFHASVAGLGGCPYAKGATGNVATEDVLYLMNGLGIETGIDLDAVVAIGDFISTAIGRTNASRVGRALLAKAANAACAS